MASENISSAASERHGQNYHRGDAISFNSTAPVLLEGFMSVQTGYNKIQPRRNFKKYVREVTKKHQNNA